jgi:hypothetical protein
LQVDFGAVLVSNTVVREKLVATQKDFISRLIKAVQGIPRASMVATTRKYKELQSLLIASPTTVEDVDSQRTLIQNLPSKIREIVDEMEAAQPWCEMHYIPTSSTPTCEPGQQRLLPWQ